jgi:thioredoxin reductase
MVVSVERASPGFEICLEDGETIAARKVVVAVGISHFQYLPEVLSGLSNDYITHSSRHSRLDGFQGREVTVVGAGASALDLAALLHQAKASVHLVARRPVLRFHSRRQIPRPLLQRIRHPTTGVGPGWKSLFITKAPLVFRQLPERFRLDFVSRYLGPAPCWFVKDEVVGKVPFHLGVNLAQPKVQNGRVILPLTDASGSQRTLVTDHIIAATGYRVDLRRLKFLRPQVLKEIRSVSQTPVLSSNFESSVDGLYFVGATAANTFGPLLRFAYGAGFAARRITNHLARSAAHHFARVDTEPELIGA